MKKLKIDWEDVQFVFATLTMIGAVISLILMLILTVMYALAS